MVGNFIADSVKGKRINDYPSGISRGILLHRKIDNFSDQHPMVKASKKHFHSVYGKYSGVAVDIIYDHFLAVNFQQYTSLILNNFATNCYKVLLKHWPIMPWEVKLFLPFLIKHKRLQSYACFSGLSNALNIMSRRTSFPDKTKEAIETLKECYPALQKEFECFFGDVVLYVKNYQENA